MAVYQHGISIPTIRPFNAQAISAYFRPKSAGISPQRSVSHFSIGLSYALFLSQAIENVKPMVEVRSKRVGGANYQVPVEVGPRRGRALAFRWVLEAARGRRGRPMRMALADELVAAYNREGGAMMKRENAHKQAEANKAFAHFAF